MNESFPQTEAHIVLKRGTGGYNGLLSKLITKNIASTNSRLLHTFCWILGGGYVLFLWGICF